MERVNGLSTSSGNSPLPFTWQCNHYEKDKVFAVQLHLVAKEGSKKHSLSDRDLEYGPPDKAQHFCDDDFSLLPKIKPVHKKSQKGKK